MGAPGWSEFFFNPENIIGHSACLTQNVGYNFIFGSGVSQESMHNASNKTVNFSDLKKL